MNLHCPIVLLVAIIGTVASFTDTRSKLLMGTETAMKGFTATTHQHEKSVTRTISTSSSFESTHKTNQLMDNGEKKTENNEKNIFKAARCRGKGSVQLLFFRFF
jgi:hypothetical protein